MAGRWRWQAGALVSAALALGTSAQAADPDDSADAADGDLSSVTVTAGHAVDPRERFPAAAASVSQARLQESVNSVDVEDAVKYLPGLFVRKRNYGDTQPVLATRAWGVNSSARTLVFVDDIPISALIANNNTIGAPRWGVVAPGEIDRVDMLYGPYSSEYSGNAMGGVMRITTRQPTQTEITLEQTGALQSFDLYGTEDHYPTSQTTLTAGGQSGRISWLAAATFQASASQPLAFITAGSPPAGSTGTIPELNKLGQEADVLGAGGLLHTHQTSVLLRLGVDLTPVWTLTPLLAYWRNVADSQVQTYLRNTAGLPTYGRAAGFASSRYNLQESHLMSGLSLRSHSQGAWDGEAVVTFYDFLQDRQRSPSGVNGGGYTATGRLADLGGTQWGTVDLKGIWRPGHSQEVSLGLHADRYTLRNPTYNTPDWPDGQGTSLYTSARGRTETLAVWLQDVWNLNSAWQATLGARYEHWKAAQGSNFTAAGSAPLDVQQPSVSATGFSPKASLRWRPSEGWTLTGSVARSVRFPTVSELYQLVSTGTTFASPNPDLAPERDLSAELSLEHATEKGQARLSLFHETTQDALISQTNTQPGIAVPVTSVVNVGKIRNRGIELAAQQADVLPGLTLDGSVTFVDSTILSDPTFVSTTGTRAEGRHAPYVPRWRATLVATYHWTPRWAFTLGARYSGTMYSTLDNTDTTSHVYGAFDSFLVLDARIHAELTRQLSASLGVDNLTNRNYFLFHPFPQRTVVADLRLRL